jgi:hypothetical protein
MVTRDRTADRGRVKTDTGRGPEWKTPRGGDIRTITRDASGQVIDRYSEALKKLREH